MAEKVQLWFNYVKYTYIVFGIIGAAIPVTNPNPDHQARRRTRNPDPVHAPDPSPGMPIFFSWGTCDWINANA